MARCNISHFPDDPVDVDSSIKKRQRQKLKQWLRKLRRERKSEYAGPKKSKIDNVSSSPSSSLSSSSSDVNPHPSTAQRGEVASAPGRGHVLVLEIGSGDSHHGLRAESELLLSTHPEVGFGKEASFIRINPDVGNVPILVRNNTRGGSQEERLSNVSCIRLGALAAFELLLPFVLNKNSSNSSSSST